MSARAAALGVVKRLADGLGDETGTRVGYRPTLKPGPIAGQWFVSVGNSTYVANSRSGGDCIDSLHTVSICVTAHMGSTPLDRQDALLLRHSTLFDAPPGIAAEGRPAVFATEAVLPGVVEIGELCHDLLLQDYEAVKALNFYLGTDKSGEENNPTADGLAEWGFCEPFHGGQFGTPQPVGANWVAARDGVGGDADVYALILTVTGARCIRPSRYWRGLDRELFSE